MVIFILRALAAPDLSGNGGSGSVEFRLLSLINRAKFPWSGKKTVALGDYF